MRLLTTALIVTAGMAAYLAHLGRVERRERSRLVVRNRLLEVARMNGGM